VGWKRPVHISKDPQSRKVLAISHSIAFGDFHQLSFVSPKSLYFSAGAAPAKIERSRDALSDALNMRQLTHECRVPPVVTDCKEDFAIHYLNNDIETVFTELRSAGIYRSVKLLPVGDYIRITQVPVNSGYAKGSSSQYASRNGPRPVERLERVHYGRVKSLSRSCNLRERVADDFVPHPTCKRLVINGVSSHSVALF
jgi:hypothetical protein